MTHEGRRIELVSFKQRGLENRTASVLFNGAHHSRELITIKMTLSILLKLLHGVHFSDSETLQVLKTTQVFVIPVVNLDGVAFIEANEKGDGSIQLKRKNGRVSGSCKAVDEGVDLNRNYNVSWAKTWTRDFMTCSPTYRGPEPFSEPETRTMRDFITAHKSTLKFVVNYHSFGNMFLIPYSGANGNNTLTPE